MGQQQSVVVSLEGFWAWIEELPCGYGVSVCLRVGEKSFAAAQVQMHGQCSVCRLSSGLMALSQIPTSCLQLHLSHSGLDAPVST